MSREAHVQFCERLGVKLPGATHLILGFQHQTDADRFSENLRERLGMFGLELHPDKTRRIEFGVREERIRAIRCKAQDDPQAHAGEASTVEAGAPQAYA
jgi:hypothetical protein